MSAVAEKTTMMGFRLEHVPGVGLVIVVARGGQLVNEKRNAHKRKHSARSREAESVREAAKGSECHQRLAGLIEELEATHAAVLENRRDAVAAGDAIRQAIYAGKDPRPHEERLASLEEDAKRIAGRVPILERAVASAEREADELERERVRHYWLGLTAEDGQDALEAYAELAESLTEWLERAVRELPVKEVQPTINEF